MRGSLYTKLFSPRGSEDKIWEEFSWRTLRDQREKQRERGGRYKVRGILMYIVEERVDNLIITN